MKGSLIGFNTIVRREVVRFTRIWPQTLLPPAITMALYFAIFGKLIGSQIGNIHGVTYMQYIAPGLLMMSVITNSYANVSSSFFSSKFSNCIEEMIISPMPMWQILLGYCVGGILRGLVVGVIVAAVALGFTHLTIHHIIITLLMALMCAFLFSLAGFTNGLLARKFDDVTIIPNFVLTPLTYLGGVFYSLDMLSGVWRQLSHFNPIVYIINSFRYGIIGISDINVGFAFSVIFLFVILFYIVNLVMLERGVGLRS